MRGGAVGAGRRGDARGEGRRVQAVLGRRDPVGVERLDVPRVGLAAPADQELRGRVLAPARPRSRAPAAASPRAAWATIESAAAESRARSSRACSVVDVDELLEAPLRAERREPGLEVGHAPSRSDPAARSARPAACRARGSRRRAGPRPARTGSGRRAPRCRRRDSGAPILPCPARRSPSRTRSRPRGPGRKSLAVALTAANATESRGSGPTLSRAQCQVRRIRGSMAHRVTLIPGDGIGPELTEATRRVLEATGVDVRVGRPAGRRRRDGRARRQPAAGGDARVDPRATASRSRARSRPRSATASAR